MSAKDYLLVKRTSIQNVNNAEFLNFAQTVFDFLPREKDPDEDLPEIESVDAGGCPSIGLSEEFVAQMEKDLNALFNAIYESRASANTPEINEKDAGRTAVAKYLFRQIDNSAELPIESKSKPAKQVKRVISPYSNLIYLPQGQKTVSIRGLILDLRKEEIAPAITALGLDEYVNELETLNNAFIEASTSRVSEKAANTAEAGSIIRERLEDQIEELRILAQSYNIVKPTEASTEFVRRLNQSLDDTMTAYNMRIRNSSEEEEEDDRPVIPEEGTGESDRPVIPEEETEKNGKTEIMKEEK